MAISAWRSPPAMIKQRNVMRSAGPSFSRARFYIELQRAALPGGETYIQQAVALAAKLKLPVVATHPMQFMTPDDFTAHEARVCISEGDILANPRRQKRFTTEQYFRTQEEMCALFADIPSALANTVEIAKRCNLKLELGKPKLPLFPTPDGMSLDDYLVHLSKEGLEKRLVQLYPDEAAREAQRETYYARLEFECKTIIGMGFPGYFLIVADFINWAKEQRRAGRPGPRLGRRVAGGVRAVHYRPRPAANTTCCSNVS
jgi:DNA polymerase-3 subunit alpha